MVVMFWPITSGGFFFFFFSLSELHSFVLKVLPLTNLLQPFFRLISSGLQRFVCQSYNLGFGLVASCH